MTSLAVAAVTLWALFGCGTGNGLYNPAPGKYCSASADPIPLKMDNAKPVEMDKTGVDGGLPVGTLVYQKAEIFFKINRSSGNKAVPDVLALDVTHSQNARGNWVFTNNCYRGDLKPFAINDVLAATKIDVFDHNQIHIDQVKSFSLGFNQKGLYHEMNDSDPEQYNNLDKIYRLNLGQAVFYEHNNNAKTDPGHYEVRATYPYTLDSDGETVSLEVAITYQYYPPNETAPADPFATKKPSKP